MPDRLTEVTVCALRAKDFIRKIVCQSVLSQLLLPPPPKNMAKRLMLIKSALNTSLNDFEQNRSMTPHQIRLYRSHDEDIWTLII